MAKGGEELQFEEIYARYYKEVYYYLLSLDGNRETAEELTQETFFRAMKSIHKFKGECGLGTWLCQIAKYTYFSWKKKHRREVVSGSPEETKLANRTPAGRMTSPAVSIQPGQNHSPMGLSVEEQVGQREESMEIYRILHCLEEPYKEVFTLRVLGELSYREIGEVFGRKEGWARVTFHRAKIKIQQLVQKGGQ